MTLAVSNRHFATDDGQEEEDGIDDGVDHGVDDGEDDDDDDNGEEEGDGGVGDCEEENELPQWLCKIG